MIISVRVRARLLKTLCVEVYLEVSDVTDCTQPWSTCPLHFAAIIHNDLFNTALYTLTCDAEYFSHYQ